MADTVSTPREGDDDMCACGHTRYWHGAGEWCCEAGGPDHPEGDCRCSPFEDAHDPRLTCGGSGKCPGCSSAYLLRIVRRERDELRASLSASAPSPAGVEAAAAAAADVLEQTRTILAEVMDLPEMEDADEIFDYLSQRILRDLAAARAATQEDVS